jgi:hypothetical protein
MQALHNTPGKLFMQIRTIVLSLAVTLPFLAQAAQSIDNSTLSCTQSLVDNRATTLTFSCEGDLTITGGTWTTDTLISLSATGSMLLQGITFNTPSLSLKAQSIVFDSIANLPKDGVVNIETVAGADGTAPGALQLTPGSKINIEGATIPAPLTGGDIQLGAGRGGDISLRAAVPEPESYALALAALATGAALARRRKA